MSRRNLGIRFAGKLSIGRVPTFTLTALLFVGLGLYGASLTYALTVHKFKATFGETGSNPGQFKDPAGVAVNVSTGDLYVADTGNNRIERFDALGSLRGRFDGSGVFEVEGKVESGVAAGAGTLGKPEMIAIDNSTSLSDPSKNDVYVVDRSHGLIDKFTAVGEYVGQIVEAVTCTHFEPGEASPCSITGLAVDAEGNLWVSVDKGPIYRYSTALANQQSSECESTFGGVSALSVDSEDNLYFQRGESRFAKVDKSCKTLVNPFSEDRSGRRSAVDTEAHVVYLDDGEVIESFDAAGDPIESSASSAPAPAFGAGHLGSSRGVAVNSLSHEVYASDSERNDVVAFEAITLPTVVLVANSNQQPRGVTLNGQVNPEGRPVTACAFEYDTVPYEQGEGAHGTTVECSPASLGSGETPVAVSAAVTGLTPQTTYYYRLVAENSAGLPSATAGQQFFTGPLVEGQWSTEVASESVTLQTHLNANGGDTTYYVEYGSTPAFGQYAPVPPPGSDVGAAGGVQTVSVHLQRLNAATTYYYNFVAVQAGERFGCDNTSAAAGECDASFVTRAPAGATGLPDGRVWELVSPPDKHGALIEAETEQGGDVQAAADGAGVTYVTRGPSIGGQVAGHVTYSQVLSRRKASRDWRSEDLTLPGRLPEDGRAAISASTFDFEYRLFSPTLNAAAVEPQISGTPPLSPEATERTLYIRDNESGVYTPLVTSTNVMPETKIEPVSEGEQFEWELHFLAATPDLAHVLFKTPAALTANAVDEESPEVSCAHSSDPHCTEAGNVQWNLYEWGGGQLKLVNVLPDGTSAHGKLLAGFPGVRLAGTRLVDGRGQGGAPREISADGRRVAWTWGEPYTSADLDLYRGLYVRDTVDERTVQVGGSGAVYQTMSSDGSRIFYIEGGELFEYHWSLGSESGSSVDLTEIHEMGEPSAGVEETVTDVSEDGSYVYFVAKGVLASGGVPGENNLYLLHEASGTWETTFIAALAEGDRPTWYATISGIPYLANISSRVSPNGRFFAFMSARPLTGYDNVDVNSGQRDEEVFLYDAEQNRLVCASCNPAGSRPVGVLDTRTAELLVDRQGTWTSNDSNTRDPRSDHWLAGSVPAWDDLATKPTTYQPRYLSNDGRLFFDSPDALVPRDTNGLEDVYEFDPTGVGGCESASESATQVYVSELAGHLVEGCVGLLSAGTSGAESAFLDTSESGADVFFVTSSKLVGEDYDKGFDVYDAHVCSDSVPCVAAVEVAPPCASGDTCKPPPGLQPTTFGAPPSATFEGLGNLSPVAARKVGPKKVTNAEKLARALRECRRKRGRRRVVCERKARRAYPVRKTGHGHGQTGKGAARGGSR